MIRDIEIGKINKKHLGKVIKICGWVKNIRKHGRMVFLDLYDLYGTIQCVIKQNAKGFKNLENLTRESCILVEGKLRERPKKQQKNQKYELDISKIKILNLSNALPFSIEEKPKEETRLKYRYLDLRQNKSIRDNLILRHRFVRAIRDYLNKNNFIEIETPILAKSTPEGARDFLVPSRLHKGKFFALPQSPQIFKQLLMISGFDKYFQIAKCFRDEDLRADRQPEFTQIDLEMSFVDRENVMSVVEKMLKYAFKKTLNKRIKIPFRRIKYKEAINKYGTDKPLIGNDEFNFLWITDFPLFEYSNTEKRIVSVHHPFTMPNLTDYKKNKYNARSLAYDLILNGVEIGGGSIRINNPELQTEVFKLLGLKDKEIKTKFGFFIEALKYGAPPHGGIALGLDRIIQIITNSTSIRDVIAFPKTKDMKDLMLDAPNEVKEEQLKDLGINL